VQFETGWKLLLARNRTVHDSKAITHLHLLHQGHCASCKNSGIFTVIWMLHSVPCDLYLCISACHAHNAETLKGEILFEKMLSPLM
jgi:hypothetical protein